MTSLLYFCTGLIPIRLLHLTVDACVNAGNLQGPAVVVLVAAERNFLKPVSDVVLGLW